MDLRFKRTVIRDRINWYLKIKNKTKEGLTAQLNAQNANQTLKIATPLTEILQHLIDWELAIMFPKGSENE